MIFLGPFTVQNAHFQGKLTIWSTFYAPNTVQCGCNFIHMCNSILLSGCEVFWLVSLWLYGLFGPFMVQNAYFQADMEKRVILWSRIADILSIIGCRILPSSAQFSSSQVLRGSVKLYCQSLTQKCRFHLPNYTTICVLLYKCQRKWTIPNSERFTFLMRVDLNSLIL